MFTDGLYEFITAQSAITALLGTSRGDKTTGVFHMLAIGNATMPYMTYQRVAGAPETFSYQGANQLTTSRFRFSCYGTSQRNAALLADALKSAFATWTGTFPDGTVVENVMLEFESDDIESVPKGTIYAVHCDFSFSYLAG
jgi:hypothetical protein